MRLLLWEVGLTVSLLLGCGPAPAAHLPGKLAFVSDRFVAKAGDALSKRGVCVLDDGRIRKICADANFPHWSKDGKRLYCKNMGGEKEDIFVLAYPSGKMLKKLDLPNNSSRAFALLPDESGLIYVGWNTSFAADGKEIHTSENLYEYNFSTGNGRQLTHFIDTDWPVLTEMDVSPDGNWVVFTRDKPEPEEGVYLLNRQTGQLRKLVVGRGSRFTPDGRVLFVSHFLKGEHMKTAEVFTYDLTTEAVERLTHNGPDDLEYAPVMSPDGRYVAYEIREFPPGTRPSGLYVINADGTHEHKVLGGDGHVYLTPDWGP